MTTALAVGLWRDFVYRMTHPDKIPPQAMGGGINPELAWQRWAENRAAEAKGHKPPHEKLSSQEVWWFARFDRGWQQEYGAGPLGRHPSDYDQRHGCMREHQRHAEGREAGE
jgi:hypothetical protein